MTTFATREALLGASDLVEREIDLPSIKMKVKVRSLPAAYSNQAVSEALEMATDARGRQTSTVNTVKLEALQVLHGLVEPKLNSIEDAYTFSQRNGPAWREIVRVIDEISGVNKEEIEKANATFRAGGPGEPRPVVANGSAGRDAKPDLPVSAGARAAHADR